MAKRKLEPQHDEHINVTPLIDVVMCLIIFFMVCGRLAQQTVESGITIPKASRAEELADQKNRLVINIVPDIPPGKEEEAKTDPSYKLRTPKLMVRGREVSNENLTEELRKEKNQNPDLRLVIRADREMPYPPISRVIVSCAQADIKSLHFATELEQ